MKYSTGTLLQALGVVIILFGVFVNVALVGSEQDIRRQAKEQKEHKVQICHKTGSDSNPWVQIEVSENAVESHLSQGDIVGSCPSPSKPEEKKEEKEKEKEKTPPPAVGGINTVNNVTVNNTYNNPQEDSNQQIPTPQIQYIYITTRFDFWIKFDAIEEKKADKQVRVVFVREDEEMHVYNKVIVKSDSKGIYHGTITDVRPGKFVVLITSDGYLQRNFGEINIKSGSNKFYWQQDELISGDFDADNKIDAKDIAEIMAAYSGAYDEEVFDVNMDESVNLQDIRIILDNYNNLEVFGDE